MYYSIDSRLKGIGNCDTSKKCTELAHYKRDSHMLSYYFRDYEITIVLLESLVHYGPNFTPTQFPIPFNILYMIIGTVRLYMLEKDMTFKTKHSALNQ